MANVVLKKLNYSAAEINDLLARIMEVYNREDHDTIYDDTEVRNLINTLATRVTAAENKEDNDTIYDDTEIRSLIASLNERLTSEESKVDNDTVYDDTEIRSLITSLAERMTAEENKVDNDTVYDDTEIVSRVTVLEEKVSVLESREDADTIYDDTVVRELISNLTERVTTIENDPDETYDDTEIQNIITALTNRVNDLELREDKDTVYNDEEVRAMITELQDRMNNLNNEEDIVALVNQLNERISEVEAQDKDTVYDDNEIREIISALTDRVTAVENDPDADTVYDDTEVKNLLNALSERIEVIDNKTDKDTVYDDTEVRNMINELANRVTAVENDPDADTVYDDTEVKGLIDAITARVNELEGREDHDTVYDDTDIQSKYTTLNDKYNNLFNYVYSNVTGEAATALNADYVANTLNNDTTVTVTEGELGDVTIPAATKTVTVTAPMQDNATVTLTSPKAINLNNTSENPVAVTIDAPAGTSVPNMNVSGNFTTLEVNNGSITGKNDATVSNVIINNDIEKNASVTGVVYNDNATITTDNLPKLGLANNNNSENIIPSATINAENTTVTLNKSQWNELTSNVSDNTLNVTQNAHINKLIVGKGNVVVYDNDMSNRIDEIVNDTEYTVDLNRNNATVASEVGTLLTGNPGIITLTDDFSRGTITGGIFWSGNYTLDLAGHTLELNSPKNAGIMGRNTVNITIIDSVGGGKLINNGSYGLWAGDNSVFTIDVPESTEIIAVTHVLYCEGSKKPHINVKGGTYKMTLADDDTNAIDDNGNYRYMLNHLDSTFTREGNCFNITGGRFVGFDPSHANGEPGGEYSMVDLNEYEVLTENIMVDGMNVYKVVKK